MAACLVLLSSQLHAQELTPRQIAARARPAVVLIEASEGSRELGQGSGFLVDPSGVLITSLHVIEGADALKVHTSSGEIYDNVYFIAADRRKDLAIIKIPGTGLPALPLGDERKLEVGEKVYVMGNPLGLEGTFSDGILSAKRVDEGVAYLQITAPISPGSSGGPVLNSAGEVVGIATALLENGQNLNIAVSSRYASGMIAMGERPRPLSQATAQLAPSRPRSAAASAPAASDDDDADLQPWEVSVGTQVLAFDSLMAKYGIEPSHKLGTGYLKRGDRYTHSLELDPGAYVIAAFCDDDCEDIDLSVYDPRGDRVASDYKDDDYPTVRLDAYRGRYRVVVYMADCSTANCFYAVRASNKQK